MSEKKELKKEELEKVTGGYSYPKDIVWLFCKDAIVNIKLDDNTTVEGNVTKKGWIGLYHLIKDVYYVESTTNSNINGWYCGNNFNNGTVSIKDREYLTGVNIVAW